MSKIIFEESLNKKKVDEIYSDIQPKFDLLVNEVVKKHQCLELLFALLPVVLTIALAAAEHIFFDDYLAARKFIDEILDHIGDPSDGKE